MLKKIYGTAISLLPLTTLTLLFFFWTPPTGETQWVMTNNGCFPSVQGIWWVDLVLYTPIVLGLILGVRWIYKMISSASDKLLFAIWSLISLFPAFVVLLQIVINLRK